MVYTFNPSTLSDSEQFINAIAVIDSEYTAISCAKCQLGTIDSDTIARGFISIGPSVIEIDLSINGLSLKTPDELIIILTALPKNIKRINLSGNGISTWENLGKIIQTMHHVQEVVLVDKTVPTVQRRDLGVSLSKTTGKRIITQQNYNRPYFFPEETLPSDNQDNKSTAINTSKANQYFI